MRQALEWVTAVIAAAGEIQTSAQVTRGLALSLPQADSIIDAVITDPPYYDNVPYADVSDFFYVWLKRSIGQLLANWRSVIEDNVFTPSEQADKKRGQKRIFE